MNWYKMSQQEITYEKALSIEKWIIATAKQMHKIFVSFNGEFKDISDYKKYMERVNPLINVVKNYIDELKGYPTVSQGIERNIVEISKNVIGDLVSTSSHTVTNKLIGLFAAIDFAENGGTVELV